MRKRLLPVLSMLLTITSWSLTAEKPLHTLYMVFGDSSPPVYWSEIGATRNGHGLLPELMALIDIGKGVKLEATFLPLPRVQFQVQSGESDSMINVITPARLEYSVVSKVPIVSNPVKFFVYRKSAYFSELQKVRTLDDLTHLPVTVGAITGSGWTKTNVENRGIHVDYSPGTPSGIKKLAIGRVDLVIDVAMNVRWILRSTPNAREVVELPLVVETVGWYLMVSKKSPWADHMEVLDQAILAAQKKPAWAQILKSYGVEE